MELPQLLGRPVCKQEPLCFLTYVRWEPVFGARAAVQGGNGSSRPVRSPWSHPHIRGHGLSLVAIPRPALKRDPAKKGDSFSKGPGRLLKPKVWGLPRNPHNHVVPGLVSQTGAEEQHPTPPLLCWLLGSQGRPPTRGGGVRRECQGQACVSDTQAFPIC